MKILNVLFCLLCSEMIFAQLPDTDIFLAEIKNDRGKISFSTPQNITGRNGYDNQPYFTPDGKSILYVALMDTIQTDVYRYDLSSKKNSKLTFTRESEYSPAYSSHSKNMYVVRVDEDKGQRLYQLSLTGIEKAIRVEGTEGIGYYCELNDSLLAMFMLGESMTLQVLNTRTHEQKLIAGDIGRCMKLSTDRKHLLFVIKQNSSEWGIFKMNMLTGSMTKITNTLDGSEDFAILPDESLLMGSEGKLFQYHPGNDSDWSLLADFSSTLKSFYRIAISQKGDRIAFVAYTGMKP